MNNKCLEVLLRLIDTHMEDVPAYHMYSAVCFISNRILATKTMT